MNQAEGALAIPEFEPEAFRSIVNSSVCSMEYEISAGSAPCNSYFGGVNLAGIDVFRFEGIGFRRGHRGSHHIREDHVDDFLICVPLQARIDVVQNGRMTVTPGNFAVYSTCKPFEASISAADRCSRFSCVHVRVSGALLRKRVPHIDDCCERPIGIRKGSSHVMKSLLEMALSDAAAMTQSQAYCFSTMLIDAIGSATSEAPEFSGNRGGLRHSAHERIFQQASAYIETKLCDAALDADQVAQHCHVSSRYLRAVFASFSTTVNQHIRELRLQRSREALQTQALAEQSVTQIAMRWGFNDSAYFSRAYKLRFGKAPSEDRRQSPMVTCLTT